MSAPITKIKAEGEQRGMQQILTLISVLRGEKKTPAQILATVEKFCEEEHLLKKMAEREKKRKQRENNKSVPGTNGKDETPISTNKNNDLVPGTPPLVLNVPGTGSIVPGTRQNNGNSTHHVPGTTENAIDLLTSIEVNNKNNKKETIKGSRLQIHELPLDWKKFCEEKRPDLDPHETFEEFKDWWMAAPGQRGVKADWPATWRTWVRNQKAKQNLRNSKPSGVVEDPHARLERINKQRNLI